MDLRTTDYHTAGEPFRIVVSDIGEIAGANVRERRESAAATERIDRLRRLLCHEPRGHADMYGCFVVPPDDEGAAFGVLFWHKDGYSTACGHGTIALGAWAVESGRVAAPTDGRVDVVIDVPSGRVTARVRCAAGAVDEVAFVNVPASVTARGVDAGEVEADVAWGGAFYAFVLAEAFGLRVTPEDLPALIVAGRGGQGRAGRRASLATPPRRPTLRHLRHRPDGGRGAAPPAQRGDLRRRRGRPLADGVGDVGAHGAAAGRRRDRHR
jgi:proline racemase